MDQPFFLALGAIFCLTTITYFALNKAQRDLLAKRFYWRGRRASTAATPPRSLSPEKKAPNNGPAPANYTEAFPPHRREALAEIAPSLSPAQQQKLIGHEVSDELFKKSILPFTANYAECDGNKFTPTRISVDEIKALGDFPDYATLSGVPLPQPYKEFNIDTALPRPYRPFRWAYHQTMSLTKLEPDWWLELESTYKARIAQRKGLYEKYGKLVLQYLPGSELACKELMEMALQFLCARYPQYFELGSDKKTFKNRILETEQDVSAKHPLLVLLDNVPEDFAITLRNPEDGYYYFRAGVICSALGWNVNTKIGMSLKDIHKPIPDYKQKMEFSMDRFFSKMPIDRPIQRGSWGLEVDKPLFMPPGDPHEKYREYQAQDLTLDRCHLRVDWQTLRRLPYSGGIVFNFKAVFSPVEEFRDEPYIPSIILKILNEGKKNLMEYKNTWHVEHICKPALEQYQREQEEQGLIPKDWEVETLEQSPWFPGWADKWHRQQGF
ncbi:putative alpha-mannosyltransferase [Phaeomoniella chlamydospora]|uniref:Putative alpha-mannosyltransferase n=1 Tax=Phaeomoniella chlamydospora TaxID=158046 RepID=A0A0G2GD11_PHACM|nr:putative alpha-mannosyltransferase [Phaeomoniella chlamydospora]